MNKDQIKSFKDSRLKGLESLSETNVDKSKFKSDNIKKPVVGTVRQESPAVALPPLEDLFEEAAYKEPKVSSPVKERKVSPALEKIGDYIVSDTITGQDIKLNFENMYNIFKSSFNKINPLSSIRSESKIRKIYLGLSSYYKYGYYKDNNTSSLYDYLYRELKSKKDANRIIASLSDAKLYLMPYSYNNKNTSVLTVNIKFGNDDLNVPLMVTNNAVSEKTEFNGDINPTFVEGGRDQISSNGENSKIIYGSEFEDIGFGDVFRIVGDPMILSKSDDLDFQDKVSKERFYRDNVGKTMMVISSDPLSSQDDYWRFLRSDKETLFTLTQDPRFRIIGVNKHVSSSNQLFELVSKLKGSENYNILSRDTLAKVLSSIYSVDKNIIISKIAKQIFINHPDWYIKVNGKDNIYKSESDLMNID